MNGILFQHICALLVCFCPRSLFLDYISYRGPPLYQFLHTKLMIVPDLASDSPWSCGSLMRPTEYTTAGDVIRRVIYKALLLCIRGGCSQVVRSSCRASSLAASHWIVLTTRLNVFIYVNNNPQHVDPEILHSMRHYTSMHLRTCELYPT